MIAKLTGRLDSVSLHALIIDVGGVGYEVHASARTLSRIGQPGEALALLIEMQVREDAFKLYGFIDAAEQQWFRLLTSVQGVGAKAAMAILSVTPPEQLGFAIASGDQTALTRADGVGQKLAARILTELKDKAGKIDLAPKGVKAAPAKGGEKATNTDVDQDAVSALVNLGYARTDAYAAVLQARKKANDNSKLNDIIKLALKELAS